VKGSADNSVQIREMYDIELILREIAVKIQIYHQQMLAFKIQIYHQQMLALSRIKVQLPIGRIMHENVPKQRPTYQYQPSCVAQL